MMMGRSFPALKLFQENIQIDWIVIQIELFSIKPDEKVDKFLSSFCWIFMDADESFYSHIYDTNQVININIHQPVMPPVV